MPIKNSISRVFKLLYKEFSLIKGDKRALFMALVLPPLIISAFGLLGSVSNVKGLPVKCAAVTYDPLEFYYSEYNTSYYNASWDQVFIEMLNNNQFNRLKLIEFYNASLDPYALHNARMDLANDEVDLIILIPTEFTEAIEIGFPSIIDCIPDGSNVQNIQTSLNLLFDAIFEFLNTNNITPQFNIEAEPVFGVPQNANETTAWASTISLPFLVIGSSLVLTILSVVNEKPIPRLLLTPAKKSEVLAAKYIANAALMIAQCVLIVTFASIFGLYVAGSMLNLFIALFITGFYGMCIGMLISTISGTETQANQLLVAVFLIMILLSGMFIPVENMNIVLQIIAYGLPFVYGVPLISEIAFKAKGFTDISLFFNFTSLVLLCIGIILITYLIFRIKRKEV
ncbi:MAG: ABC transporter permease subunit [Candidatus Lokiarchaeota archaeon]|nr:ABC transporter permease subunit [Candidatus Lokiarchaeota archaeon]